MSKNDTLRQSVNPSYIMSMLEQFWLNTCETNSYPEAISSLCNQFSKLEVALIEEKRFSEAELLLEAIEVVKRSLEQKAPANKITVNLFYLMEVSYSIGQGQPVDSLVSKLNNLFEAPKTPDVDMEEAFEYLCDVVVEQRSEEGRDHAKKAHVNKRGGTKSLAKMYFQKYPNEKRCVLAKMFIEHLKQFNQNTKPAPALKEIVEGTAEKWITAFRDGKEF